MPRGAGLVVGIDGDNDLYENAGRGDQAAWGRGQWRHLQRVREDFALKGRVVRLADGHDIAKRCLSTDVDRPGRAQAETLRLELVGSRTSLEPLDHEETRCARYGARSFGAANRGHADPTQWISIGIPQNPGNRGAEMVARILQGPGRVRGQPQSLRDGSGIAPAESDPGRKLPK